MLTLPEAVDIPGTVHELKAPFLSRVRKGWNEIMLMALSTGATGGTLAAIALLLWWLFETTTAK